MIATYVPPVRTPVTRELAVKAFLWALPKGLPLSAVALALAQSALETGRWASCYNWDFSNAKAGPKYEGMYTGRLCNEVLGGKLRWFLPEGECDSRWELLDGQTALPVPPGHPQTRFRAYANAYDGCLSHIELLERRFSKAWAALLTGHADTFVSTLKMQGYFTASLGPYLKAVESLQREFLRVLENEQDVPEEPIDPELSGLLALAFAAQVEQNRDDIDEQTEEAT